MPSLTLNRNVERVKRGGVVYYRVAGFTADRDILHAFSTRQGGVSLSPFGSLNLSYKVGDEELRVRQNRDLLARALGIRPEQFVIAEQVHGDDVLEAMKSDKGKCLEDGEYLGKADAIITREPGLALMVMVADCMPVLIHDPIHKTIGVAHAGWRGTASLVAVKTILRMGEKYGTKPSEVKVAMGPAIGPCCYEVGEDVRTQLSGIFPWGTEVFRKGFAGNWMLDLAEANARQLIDLGVKKENLMRSDLCTIDHMDDFYSHRAKGSNVKQTGRIGAILMLR